MNQSSPREVAPAHTRLRGFTVVELLIVVVVCALLMSIAVPTYQSHVLRGKDAVANTDISEIELAISHYEVSNNGALPPDLAAVSMDTKLDPWGNPYRYLNTTGLNGNGQGIRKIKNLVPVNTDYDLYSIGPDGRTTGALTAAASQDDIIRANNGAYIGLASDY